MAKNEYYIDGSYKEQPIKRRVHLEQRHNCVNVMIEELIIFTISNLGRVERWHSCGSSGLETEPGSSGRPKIYDV